jgi:putative flavoprotein involved in K+ transport
MTRRERFGFRRRHLGFNTPKSRKERTLSPSAQGRNIIMLDKAPNGKVSDLLSALDQALSAGDVERAVDLFQPDCYWRDLVTFTWNIKTMEGKDQVGDMLKARLAGTRPSNWKIADGEDASEADGITESWIQFETAVARGFGHIRLKGGQIWTLLTTMSELKVGGGQGGIALGARLRQLNVPTIIVEKNERPGDSWRRRYKSLCLHDPVWYDHLPYLPFPRNWPVFSPKDKIGDWLEMYTKVMELNYWGSTECKSASYDENSREWTVVVQRDCKEIVLKPKQLVLATGMSAKPSMPTIAGMDVFKGDQHHSSQHPGPDQYKNKKAVVIGSNNSAHDICAALWEAGVDVTMVQRSSTHVVRSETLMELGLSPLYSEQAVQSGMTTAKADLIFASLPYKILHEFQIPVYNAIRERDADFYKRLEKAGFLLDYGDDDSGLFMKYLRRGSGYYIDVGASELIANGSIKLKSGVKVEKLTEHSVILSDGTELPADLVVYATGYGSMNGWAADLISREAADKVGKVWGLGSNTTKDPGPWEGEQRNMWKPTQQEGLWFHGGNLHQSRHYSQFLSLQLKARLEGIPTPVYGLQRVHHLG